MPLTGKIGEGTLVQTKGINLPSCLIMMAASVFSSLRSQTWCSEGERLGLALELRIRGYNCYFLLVILQ